MRGALGRAYDDPTHWSLSTEWESVGAYRRALGGFDVKVKLALNESTTDRMLAELEIGAMDVGLIFASPGMSSTLAYQPTQREARIALPEHHPQAKARSVALENWPHERFLGFERHYGPMIFDAMVATCMRHGFSPELFPARQMHTIVSLVSGGIGVALVPASVKALHREGVVYRTYQGASARWSRRGRRGARRTIRCWCGRSSSTCPAWAVDREPGGAGISSSHLESPSQCAPPADRHPARSRRIHPGRGSPATSDG